MPFLSLEIEEDFTLIGIHCYEEDYKLAYLLNKQLNYSFYKSKDKLDFVNPKKEFDFFKYKNEKEFITLYLINNKDIHQKSEKITNSLFNEKYTSINYLIPEYQKADYLLKIKGGSNELVNELIKKLKNIKQVIASYPIDTQKLKSKNNLIFN